MFVKPATACGVLSILLATGCSASRVTYIRLDESFDQLKTDAAPAGWKRAATNPTAAMAVWQVRSDAAAISPPNVLALTETKNYDGTFNLLIGDLVSFKDLELSVRVKAVAGVEDQGGGPIWRCQDANNYYICRFNPLEGNFRVYVVADGKRRQLQSVKQELQAGRWYEIRVRMVGDQITCFLDGQSLLQAQDATITKAGRIGLWTKADAVTSFDDLVVTSLPKK